MSHPESITLLPESCPWLLLFFFTKLAAAVPGAQELGFQRVSGLKARTNLFLFHLFLSKSFMRLCLPCGGKGAWLHPHSVAGEVWLSEGRRSGTCLCQYTWTIVLPSSWFPSAESLASVSSRGTPGTGIMVPVAVGFLLAWPVSAHVSLPAAACRIWLSSSLLPGTWEFLRLGLVRRVTVLAAVCVLSVLSWWKGEGAWGVRR